MRISRLQHSRDFDPSSKTDGTFRNSLIDEAAMKDAWDALEECWRGLENVKECGTAGVVRGASVTR